MESARQFVSVVAVLGTLLVLAYLLRRHSGGFRLGMRKTRTVEVIERVVLTPQHSLHVVRVAGELLLLSAGPSGVGVIRNLDRIDNAAARVQT
jgi:flagellar biogenesis protein FliO